MTVVLSGELVIAGPGLSARLTGGGDAPATLIVEGALGARRRSIGALVRRAADSGVALVVRDGRGRRLAGMGPDVRSPLGRLLLGTARVRPTTRGLVVAVRGAAGPPSDRHGDRR